MPKSSKKTGKLEDLSVPSGKVNWEALAQTPNFKKLVSSKIRFIVPAFLFFTVYYFLLPILVGFAPDLMATPVWGKVNLAYLFALSQFFVAWAIAFFYVKAAGKFDLQADQVLKHHYLSRKGGK